jgi:hypothetical protein
MYNLYPSQSQCIVRRVFSMKVRGDGGIYFRSLLITSVCRPALPCLNSGEYLAADLKARVKERKEKERMIERRKKKECSTIFGVPQNLPDSQRDMKCFLPLTADLLDGRQVSNPPSKTAIIRTSINRGNPRQLPRRSSLHCRQRDFHRKKSRSRGKPLPGCRPLEKCPLWSGALALWERACYHGRAGPCQR